MAAMLHNPSFIYSFFPSFWAYYLLNSCALPLCLFSPFMLACCPGSTSINKAQGTKCFWMGASCWRDLSRLFIEGLVSCYHWDVAACGNCGENRPLNSPQLGSPTPFFYFLFDGVLWSVLQQWEADISTPTEERRGTRTHTANSPKLATHISVQTRSTQPISYTAFLALQGDTWCVCLFLHIVEYSFNFLWMSMFIPHLKPKVSSNLLFKVCLKALSHTSTKHQTHFGQICLEPLLKATGLCNSC